MIKRWYVIARDARDGVELGTVSKHRTQHSAVRACEQLEAQRLLQQATSFYHDVFDIRTERWLR